MTLPPEALWITAANNSTRMAFRNRGEPAGFSMLMLPIMKLAMCSANHKDLAKLKSVLESHQFEHIDATGTAADRDYPTVTPNKGLDVALDVMVSAGYAWLPVVEGHNVVGIVAMNEIIAGHQRALRRSLRLLAGANGSSVLVEAPVADTSVFVGTTVATAPWPTGSFVLSIDRHSRFDHRATRNRIASG